MISENNGLEVEAEGIRRHGHGSGRSVFFSVSDNFHANFSDF